MDRGIAEGLGQSLHPEHNGALDNRTGVRQPTVADRRRLKKALLKIDRITDPGVRASILRELRTDLVDVDPARSSTAGMDIWEIFSECARRGAAETFADAVALVVDDSPEWDTFVGVMREIYAPPSLSETERQAIARVMVELPHDVLAAAVRRAELTDLVDLGGPGEVEAAEVLAVLHAYEQGSGALMERTWRLLETVAHASDPDRDRDLHRLITHAATRLGMTERLLAICTSVSSVSPAEAGDPPDLSGETDDNLPLLYQDDTGAEDMLSQITAPPVAVPAVMRGLPPRNAYFSGRTDLLHRIRDTLQSTSEAAVLPHALQGLGGVGKTQVALEYAYRFSSLYKLVFWIPADDEQAIRRSMVSLGKALDMPETADVQYMIDNTLDAIRVGAQYSSWLLVFDNATDVKTVRKYIPSGDKGHVLITSRNAEWRGVSNFIEVDVFTPEESLAFLRQRWEHLDPEQARLLTERLGHLPLALNQAAAFHAETGIHLAEYLANYDDLVETVTGTVPADYPRPVAATWQMNFDQLRKENPAAAQLLQLCCFLSSEPISIPMLRSGRGAALRPELKKALQNELSFRRAVQALGKYALAQIDPSRDFMTVHSLVRAVLRDSLGDDDRAAVQKAAHEVLAFANPGDPDNGETWSRHRQITPHVVPSGLVFSDDPHVRQVLVDQIRFYFSTGDYAQSRRIAEHALENWRSRLGPDDVMTLRVRFHLGNALRLLGDYRHAREETLEAHSILERTLGAGHEYTLAVANSLGVDLRFLGEYQNALASDLKTLADHRAAPDVDEFSALRAANNVAINYRLLGRFTEALEIDEANVRQRRQVDVTSSDPETLDSINELTRDLIALGRYTEAKERLTERLPQFENNLGVNHRVVLNARRHLAILHRKTGHLAEAYAHAVVAEEALRGLLGPRHDATLAAAVTLVNTMRVQGDVMAARRRGEETLTAYQETFVPHNPQTLLCAVDLAIVYRALGMRAEAYESDAANLVRLRDRLGENHPHTLICAANHTNNLAAAGEKLAALELSRETYDRSLAVRAADHPNTLAVAANLAVDLDSDGRHDEAAALRGATIERMREVLGPEHPETINVERGRRTETDIEVFTL
ncbi:MULTISPECIES: FxSxx-COOH system tetratricopeptide repeat protein [unclassified Actinoplanes]|uniref:FxSxx-COOH system tetratricopeptide repeat protein n=1 Tax=unclassified Actinoplanes TaxID=2626549 RepID=UPI0012BAC622|nr:MULTISPECIES: FxSxx-COOH system tetratricopeptide repeat protein [unclassified Actinoplanes]